MSYVFQQVPTQVIGEDHVDTEKNTSAQLTYKTASGLKQDTLNSVDIKWQFLEYFNPSSKSLQTLKAISYKSEFASILYTTSLEVFGNFIYSN